jgi:hypothetical protein
VWRAVEKSKGDVVALKKLPSAGTTNSVFREPMLHHYLAHPNILELKGPQFILFYIDFDFLFFFSIYLLLIYLGVTRDEAKNEVYMVLPFVEYDLDHAINAINTPFNTAQVRQPSNVFIKLFINYLLNLHTVAASNEPAPAHRLLPPLGPHRAPVSPSFF